MEIAQIALASVTHDIISVYARQRRTRIVYSIVDEYEGEYEYEWRPKWSTKPLTMAEMVSLIAGLAVVGTSDIYSNGLIRYLYDSHAERGDDPKEMIGFVTVTSRFYPQLFAYFEAQEEAWLREVTDKA